MSNNKCCSNNDDFCQSELVVTASSDIVSAEELEKEDKDLKSILENNIIDVYT